MLQDMEDVRATPSALDHAGLECLKRNKYYVAWEAVRAELMRHVDAGHVVDLAILLNRQAIFFSEIQAHDVFCSYTQDVLTFDRLCAQEFLRVQDSEDEERKTYRQRLLDNRSTLLLTKRQLRAIVMPGQSDVLTPEQARIYRERVACSSRDSFNHNARHRPTSPLDIPIDRDQIDGRIGYDSFRKLFGKIPPPGSIQSSNSASNSTKGSHQPRLANPKQCPLICDDYTM
ncbi:hypothetical protein F4803DRAFT_542028 [Xylaria telfairii]|nr:hypothetical protein F4803DRAFT_542028 [Xylaria telfairii]